MGFGPGLMNHFLQPKFKNARAVSRGDYERGIGEINKGYDEAQGYQKPWFNYGKNALKDFKTWGSDPNAITSDPSYKWRLGQGTEAVENSAAARGGLLSGNTGKALTDYGQGAASQEYANEFSRWMQKLGIGTNASNNMSMLSSGRGNALARMMGHEGDQYFNQTLQSAQEIRAAENDFNNVLQSWVPSSAGGGSPTGGASNTSGGGGMGGYQGTADNFGQQYSGGNYGGGYF